MAEPIVREIHIKATPEVVFQFFVDPAKLTRWLAVDATLDPRPGGICHQVHEDTDGQRYDMRGEFVEVDPPSRVVFTWGFVSGGGVGPGASTVEVTLTADGGGTQVRLVHRDLPAPAVGDHAGGWTTMLDRLATAVASEHPRVGSMSDTDWLQLKSITLHEAGEVPQLWPDSASDEYVAARQELLAAEIALCDQLHAVARLRRALPKGAELPPYTLAEGPRDLEADGPLRPVSLADLFGDHESLVVYHLMFHPDDDQACAMCSLWVDGLHGVSHHITRRAALAVVGKAPVDKLRRWARHRGWHGLRIVSSYGTSFNADLHVEVPAGGQSPAVSVFARDRDRVRHVLTQSADYPDRAGPGGGIDLLSPVWNVFDLLPEGRGDWLPDNTYPGPTRG